MYRIASRTVADYWRTYYKANNGLECGSCSKAQSQKCKEDYLYTECPKAINLDSLNQPIIDSEGHTTELGELIADDNTLTSFDTNEALKVISSLKVLSDSKSYPIDLTISNGKMIMSNPDDKGQAEIPADTQGEGKVRIDGSYLADALRAYGGMVELKLTDGKSPMLFTSPDYELVVMPMLTSENQKPEDKAETTEPEAEPYRVKGISGEVPEPISSSEQAEVEEAKAITKAEKPKRKRSKAKEPVAVA